MVMPNAAIVPAHPTPTPIERGSHAPPPPPPPLLVISAGSKPSPPRGLKKGKLNGVDLKCHQSAGWERTQGDDYADEPQRLLALAAPRLGGSGFLLYRSPIL
ncbi:hypothetical protein NHX12_025145 [Muraenolepis orangiensis]|uniref:Uncharacterized protein n=1 Tax=Muraenolepis orangiensis TaxID=630683 RepID=A0A9Q0IRZ3_9TELE|nr:hypothetical protein NHX12_025145 [Muraenolepis orangiensis]